MVEQFGGNRLSFSADGRRLLVNQEIIDARTGQLVHAFDQESRNPAGGFDPSGQFVVGGSRENPTLIDAETFATVAALPPASPIQFERTGRRFTARDRESVAVYDVDTLNIVRKWMIDRTSTALVIQHGRTLAAATSEQNILLLDIESGREFETFSGHTGRIMCLAELPVHGLLVSGAEDRTIRLWRLDTMEEVAVLRGHRDTIHDIVVTPDASTIFSASGDHTIRRWSSRPLSEVIRGRKEYEAIAQRLRTVVTAMFDESSDATVVADRIEADNTLTQRQSQIARHLVLKMSLGPAQPVGEQQSAQ